MLALVAVATESTMAQVPDDSLFQAVTRRGIDYVYNLEFENADKSTAQLIAMRPDHPSGHFFRAMTIWWRIMTDLEDTRYDEEFESSLDRVIVMCDSILDLREDDLAAMFFKGGSLGFLGRLRFHRDDWLAAADAGRRALPLVQRASEVAPTNYDIFLGTGIYNYYAEVIPREYPIVKPLMLFVPAGDRAKGLEQLTIAAEKAQYAHVEATYFLMQICYTYERDYARALSLAQSLFSRYPNNMMFHRYLGRCYVATNAWSSAKEVFLDVLERCRHGSRGYSRVLEREAEYYLGFGEMHAGRLEEALRHLYQCDELSRGLDRREPSGFMAMANLRIGMVYDLQGKREAAVRQYRKVLDMKAFKDSHDMAERYLATPYIP
jgi:tetratricopeptide (TPR) repeat protein